jgi:hypothetical protein
MISRTFSTKCGSVESLKVSTPDAVHRRGRHTRGLRHIAGAPVRRVCWLSFQCLGHDLLNEIIADLAWRPAPWLVIEAVKTIPPNLRRQHCTVLRVAPTDLAIALFAYPATASKTIQARIASPRAILRRRARRSSSTRSASVSIISNACAMSCPLRIKFFEQRIR